MKKSYYFESHGQIHRADVYTEPDDDGKYLIVIWNLHNGLVENDSHWDDLKQVNLFLKYFNAKEREEDIE